MKTKIRRHIVSEGTSWDKDGQRKYDLLVETHETGKEVRFEADTAEEIAAIRQEFKDEWDKGWALFQNLLIKEGMSPNVVKYSWFRGMTHPVIAPPKYKVIKDEDKIKIRRLLEEAQLMLEETEWGERWTKINYGSLLFPTKEQYEEADRIYKGEARRHMEEHLRKAEYWRKRAE